jgi:hypothetical protein
MQDSGAWSPTYHIPATHGLPVYPVLHVTMCDPKPNMWPNLSTLLGALQIALNPPVPLALRDRHQGALWSWQMGVWYVDIRRGVQRRHASGGASHTGKVSGQGINEATTKKHSPTLLHIKCRP